MFKYVALCCGLLLAFLLVGHLALNATGVASGTLERSEPGVGKTAITGSSSATKSAEEFQAKAAEDARYRADSRFFLTAERRKELEAAATLAGLDPNRMGDYSDSELIEATRNAPRALEEAARTRGSDDAAAVAKAMLELQQAEALKASLEAEAGITSAPGASGPTLSGEVPKAPHEMLDPVPARVEMPEYESAPAEEVPVEMVTESSPIETLLQRLDAGEQLSPVEKREVDSYLSGQLDDGRSRGTLDTTSGPDAYGYVYTDNSGNGTPADTVVYGWIELSDDPSATRITAIDEQDYGITSLTLPWSFVYYGTPRSRLFLSANGWMSFDSITATSWYGQVACFPYASANAALTPWILDGQTSATKGWRGAFYRNFGDYFVLEMDSLPHYYISGTDYSNAKYQVILWNNGKIKYQYNTIDLPTTTSGWYKGPFGIQGTTTQYTNYSCNLNPSRTTPASGRAVVFIPPSYVNNFGTIAITSPLATNVYGASQVLSVSATFLNLGSATQTAPVKYRFNNGSIVEETSAELDSTETDPHTFATTITTPADTGNYPLWAWSDLATDENRLNDTMKINVRVFPGGGCGAPIEIVTAGPDSATYNNNGAGTNSPGISCYANNYNDMVFKKQVLAGHKVTIWVSSLAWTSKYMNAALRWSGNCPGDSLVKCVYNQSAPGLTGYNQKFVWTNMTGSTQWAYFIIGAYYSGSSYAGNFKLAWMDTEYDNDFSVTAITSPLTSAYMPSQVVTVTGTAINLGLTEQSAPIKYSFNAGGAVEEATASLVRFATESHSFATQITLPASNGNYSLWVWTDLATDQDRTNDTTKMTVKVFGGNNCATVFELITDRSDSLTFNNCGADSNNPGAPCYPTSCYSDMVVKKSVEAGRTITFWVSSMSASSKYIVASMRWGGACPGTNHIVCPPYSSSAPGINRLHMWTNTTGSTQWVYFTFGNYYGSSSYCGNIKLAWKDELCAAVDPPLTENFDGAPAHMYKLPSCWTREDADGLSPIWECYGTYPRSTPYDVSIGYLAAGNNDWLFSPGINMEEGRDYFLSYWRRVGSATYPDSIEVKAGLAPTAAAMNISVCPTDTCKSTVYVQKLGGFTAPTSDVYYIGWRSMTISTSARTYIDDINIDASTTCTGGTVTVNSATAADSVTLTAGLGGGWSGGVPRYQWYTGVGCVNGNQVPGATTSSYKTYVSGIFSCRVYVVDSLTCVACDSGFATVVDCITGSYWLSETFESVTTPALPVCWLEENLDTYTYHWVTSTTYPHTGTKYATVYGYVSTGAPSDWLYSRALQLSSDTLYHVGYWYRASSTSYTHSLEVYAGQAQNFGAMTIAVDPPRTVNSTTYAYRDTTFTPPTTGVYYVGWHGSSALSQSGYICVDDIGVWPDGECTPPTSLTVNSVMGADSAKLRAIAMGGLGGGYQYQWYTGDSCETGSEIEGATVESLWVFDSGDYSCKVWIVDDVECALCDSGYADVIDCGVPLTLPVFEGFESTTDSLLPVCWQWADVNADGRRWKGFYSASYPPRSGMRNAYCTYSSGTAANDWMFTRGVALTAGDTVVVDYWYRCYLTSATYSESLELLVGTAPEVGAMTTIVDTNFVFSAVASYVQRSGLFIVPATATYYFGWHAGYLVNQGGVMIDDIAIYEYGICAPPVVDVPSVASQVYVTLTCGVTGGLGGPIQYQWYTGDTCLAGNEIVGATGRQYTTFTSGNFSCLAWFVSPDTCSDCDSATATVIPDPCLPGGIPPIYEPWASAGLPTCWSQENGNGDSYSWSYGSSYYYSSPYAAYLYTSTTPANDWLFSGPVQLTQDTTYRISFWRRASSATYTQTLSLYVGTNRHSSAMTTTLIAPYSFNNTTWIQDVAEYTAPATGSYYFSLRNTTSVSSGSVYADDFRIFKVGTCDEPSAVTAVGSIGPDSARLVCRTVTGGFGGALQFQWYTGEGCTALNAIVGATDSVYQAPTSGIYSCKAYYVSIDTCGTCDSTMATVIDCAPNPYNGWPTPFTEGFEGVTTPQLPDCWRQQNVNNDAIDWRTSASYYHTGTRSCYISYSASGGPQMDDWLFSKGLALTAGDTMNVEYWYRTYLTAVGDSDRLEVYAGTGARADFMTTQVDPPFVFYGSSTYFQRQAYFVVPTTATYYVGWHCTSAPYMNGVALDDIAIYKRGTCIAPTLADIPAVVYPAWVTLTANASGGFGSPIQYQWYTGVGCSPGNAIGGATTYQYTTSVSGIFSCRASRDTCGACDSAEVTITAPQPGEICSNAFTLTPPAHNDSSVVSGTTDGFYSHCAETCGTGISYSPDVFYSMTLPGSGDSACRRLTFVLRFVSPDTGDPFLVIYEGMGACCNTTLYCNDDDSLFSPLPPWDVPAQHPGWPSSYIAAEFYPGTYLIRVGDWVDSSGAYTLTVYDNGPCYPPCLAPDSLTVTMSPADPAKVWLHFNAPTIGTYKVFSTIQKNNDGNPNMGADAQWTLDTTFEVTTPGQIVWNDLRTTVAYRNYAVQHDCPILGRCCYGDPFTPSCANNTLAECNALSGTWNRYVTCESNACPVANQDPGETCAAATLLGGPLPIVVSYTTVGHVNDVTMTGWTQPACWLYDTWTVNDAQGPDVFWHYVIPQTGMYKFDMCTGSASWDASLLLFSNTCPPSQATFICGNDDASTRCATYSLLPIIDSLNLSVGQDVLIDCDGYSTTGGAFTLTITRY